MQYNKGLAFSYQERDKLYLRGLLPPAVLSQDIQAERVLLNIRSMRSSVQKLTYLMSLQERNERLFFYVLENNMEELVPLMQYPAIAEYCNEYSLMFRSLPRGLFLSLEDKGHISSMIKNWPQRRIKAICLTDGERVGTLGDLGVQAIGVPISRLGLFTALGGLDPTSCLPVTIDNGTNTESLLSDPIYVGVRHRRVKGDAYYELMDEFMTSVRRRYGTSVLIDLEDMEYSTQHKLLATYRGTFPMYSDAHFGFPTLCVAAILAAHQSTNLSLSEHRYLLVGDSPALTSIAEMLEEAMQRETRGTTVVDARKAIHLFDSKGLVVHDRQDIDDLEDHTLPYIQDGPMCSDLSKAVESIKPTVLIGLSDGAPAHAFSQQVLREISKGAERPIIMPMSLWGVDGTPGASEVSAKDAYAWTDGRCFFADRLTSEPVTLPKTGKVVHPSQLNTAHIFPGIGLGTLMSRVTRLREEMFVEVAKTLARLVDDEAREKGSLLPPICQSRDVAAHVAAAMSMKAYQAGVATELPKPHDLLETAYNFMYNPAYMRYR